MLYREKHIQDVHVGDVLEYRKTVSESDVYLFAGITGDFAPMHVDEEYARTTRFGERVAHGSLTSALVSAALARMLAPGSLSVGMTYELTGPVKFGDTITLRVEVVRLDEARRRVYLDATCTNQRGEVVLKGTAEQVMIPERKSS